VKGPQDWTLKQMHAAQRRWIAKGQPADAPDSPMGQWLAYGQLEDLQRRYQVGQSGALLAALNLCRCHELGWPSWVSTAFSEAFSKLAHFEVASFDEAIGGLLSKNAKLPALRRRRAQALEIYVRVGELRADGTAIDEAFNEVAKLMGISDSTARTDYYFVVDRLPIPPPGAFHKEIHRMRDEGVSNQLIAARLKISIEHVQQMLQQPKPGSRPATIESIEID
jgi:hypothetical protein